VVINVGAELDSFQVDDVLFLARVLRLLGQFVSVFAEIYDFADRRFGGGGDFHQIQPGFGGSIQRIADFNDTRLLSIGAD
jgi:hypothetical protein